ncbi:MAG TPA: methionine adenosyltransferase, partial [Candidatus Saccharimonadia bacterium]|nr:methionine adenosyltransferase [Candidatus Saccharimonadia bacterium]
TAVTENRIILMGEISTKADVDYAELAKQEITRLGYTKPEYGFSDESRIEVLIGTQSPEIAQGVDAEGAGDQGMMFGYACRDTPELMPLPITLAHRLTRGLDQSRETNTLPYLRPDGKAQVTVRYENDQPVEVTHVTIAVPHNETTSLKDVRHNIFEQIITPILAEYHLSVDLANLVVNGTGVWHLPGPRSDAGLTGRKIVVDGYGGAAHVGGGAFSGKDPTKVDRSGAYAARYLAKNIVAAGLADRAEVRLAYVIGVTSPVMQEVETFGTAHAAPREIETFMHNLLDTSVSGILKGLNLKRPIYHATAAYGHFGRSGFPWEHVVEL